jgi:type VI secretion system protein ImpK
VGCAALLIGLLVYLWFTFSLANQSDGVFAQISGLRVSKPSVVVPKPGPLRFAKFLEPEVREGLVSVRDESDRSVVVLRGDGLFASGSATVLDRYVPILQRVAEALNTVRGSVVVSGYTDNVPIRTARHPSNYHLSQDRAEQVVAMLRQNLSDPSRIKAQGLGDAEPIASNSTPDGRARNRRVEIVLFAAPTSPASP